MAGASVSRFGTRCDLTLDWHVSGQALKASVSVRSYALMSTFVNAVGSVGKSSTSDMLIQCHIYVCTIFTNMLHVQAFTSVLYGDPVVATLVHDLLSYIVKGETVYHSLAFIVDSSGVLHKSLQDLVTCQMQSVVAAWHGLAPSSKATQMRERCPFTLTLPEA